MNIRSFTFIGFLLVSLIMYYKAPRKYQWIFLLISNIVFYAVSGFVNFIFILLTSLTTFFGAETVYNINVSLKQRKNNENLSKDQFTIEKDKARTKKRLVLAAVLTITIGILAYLKYWNALIAFIEAQSHRNLELIRFNGNKTLLLPLGISFYTFQSISYFMDVYNAKYGVEKNFFKYFLFISFFPQLLMGPINRFDGIGKQLHQEHDFKFDNIKQGILLILFGAMKKYCVADLLVNRVSSILDQPFENLPGSMILIGILAYSIYQYADFSGGIDMMLGISKMFDLDMQQNFKQPYFSTSLADFWRRWHISLGLWMRDYVFFPFVLTKRLQKFTKWCQTHLGNQSARSLPAGLANIVVFLLVGIWHGPEMHFIIWGLFNGIIIAFSDILHPSFDKLSSIMRLNTKSNGFHIFRIIRTFIIVNIGAYFDRITDVPKSFLYLKRTFCNWGSLSIYHSKDYMRTVFGNFRNIQSELVLITVCCILIFITSVIKERQIDLYQSIQKRNIAVRWCAYYVPLVLVILSMSFAPGNPVFMYAQY